MAVVGPVPELGPPEVPGQPVGVRRRHHSVPTALHDEHGCRDCRQLDAPRGGERDVVVDQPVGPGLTGARGVGTQRRPVALERGEVGGDEACGIELVRLRVARPGVPAGDGGSQAARGGHAREPVEPCGERRDAREAHDTGHPIGEQRGAGERVRTAAGRAHRREPGDAERVHHLRDVARGGRHVATGERARAAVAGPPVRHEPDAPGRCGGQQRWEQRARLRRAVVPDDRQRIGGGVRGGVVRPQRAAVAQVQLASRHHGSEARGSAPAPGADRVSAPTATMDRVLRPRHR